MAEEFDLVSEIIRSNNLRMSDNHQLSIVKGKLQVEDREVGPDYTDMDQAIKMVGEGDEAELKDLLGKAEGIEAPPRISRQNIRNRVFQGLTNVGLDPEKSSFVADLFVGDMDTEFGLLDIMAVMSPVDIVEGIRRFRGGSKLEGGLQAGMGFAEAAPYVGKAVKTLKEPIKSAVSSVAGPAREFLEKNRGGTTLGSTDIPKMVAEGTVALDEMINKPQGPELTGSSGELGFYSKALEETKKLQQKKGTGQQFRQMLKKAGVSDDEIEWSGLETVLRKDKTTKKEIEDQLRLNKLEIREVVKDKLPEETMMNWGLHEYGFNYVKSADELKEGELSTSPSAKIPAENLMTPEEVYGPRYIDERADEFFKEKRVLEPEKYTREQARLDALEEFYNEPFIRIEDQNTGMVILGNDIAGYSIFKNMEDTKGEGAFKNAITDLQGDRLEIATLPEAKVQAQQFALDDELISMTDERMARFSDDDYRLAGGENYREFVITSDKYDDPYFTFKRDEPFQGDHFDEENIIGHFRTSDRTTMAGDKVLYIDEIQSDWGQKGREEGFRPKDINDERNIKARKGFGYGYLVVRGPFVENTPKWTDLIVKRILAKAVEEGYDMVSFSPGYIQNMRWREPGLLKYYDDILVKRVTKIVDQLDDTAFGAGNEQLGQLNKNRKSKGFGRINLDDTDFDEIEERALDQFKADGAEVFDFKEDQVLKPFTVRMTNKLKEGVKKGQSLFALPVVAGTTAMTMENEDGG
tara:strand:+ start:4605 stop:6854 length:2250 start_codon:yes stop_codon:yes gene_type:complete